MASFHLSVKTMSRSSGRSATACAAYRSASVIVDDRTGERHDYSRKRGVESTRIFLPPDLPAWASDRAQLWNRAELAETRKNSTVCREFEIALPRELSAQQRQQLAHDFAAELVARHRFAADVAIHAPHRVDGDENQNFHAHILVTTRRLTADGFGEKSRELDDLKTGEVTRWRERFAQMQNAALERAGHTERVDHRTLAAQGIERAPTWHHGSTVTAMIRDGRAHASTVLEREGDQAQPGDEQVFDMSPFDRELEALEGQLAAAKELAALTVKRAQDAAAAEARGKRQQAEQQAAQAHLNRLYESRDRLAKARPRVEQLGHAKWKADANVIMAKHDHPIMWRAVVFFKKLDIKADEATAALALGQRQLASLVKTVQSLEVREAEAERVADPLHEARQNALQQREREMVAERAAQRERELLAMFERQAQAPEPNANDEFEVPRP